MADIEFELHDGVGLIRLARPAALNVFTVAMGEELGALYRRCDEDDAVRVVVLTGSGTAFCAGADLSRGDTFSADVVDGIHSCPLPMQAWDVRKPVIAACNGHAIGIGLGIAVQCDMRVFAAEGRYGFLQNRRGVVADFGVEWLLPRLIGFERAFEMLVRGVRLDGVEAQAWGLAGRVVAAAEVLTTAMEIADDMVRNCSPLVMGMHKRLLWRGLDIDRAGLVELETRALRFSMQQPDALEGGMAYVEKRVPQWRAQLDADWPGFLDLHQR
jgi:enoyl-CoA hydratase/carnithine racemase